MKLRRSGDADCPSAAEVRRNGITEEDGRAESDDGVRSPLYSARRLLRRSSSLVRRLASFSSQLFSGDKGGADQPLWLAELGERGYAIGDDGSTDRSISMRIKMSIAPGAREILSFTYP